MDINLLLRFLHIISGMTLVGGLVSRQYMVSLIKKADDVRDLATLSRTTDYIERWTVLPGASAVFIFGIILALRTDRPILGFLTGGSENWLLLALTLLILMTVVGSIVSMPRRRKLESMLDEALAAGQITPEVSAAVADPVVNGVYLYELATVVVVLFLMVFKPF